MQNRNTYITSMTYNITDITVEFESLDFKYKMFYQKTKSIC